MSREARIKLLIEDVDEYIGADLKQQNKAELFQYIMRKRGVKEKELKRTSLNEETWSNKVWPLILSDKNLSIEKRSRFAICLGLCVPMSMRTELDDLAEYDDSGKLKRVILDNLQWQGLFDPNLYRNGKVENDEKKKEEGTMDGVDEDELEMKEGEKEIKNNLLDINGEGATGGNSDETTVKSQGGLGQLVTDAVTHSADMMSTEELMTALQNALKELAKEKPPLPATNEETPNAPPPTRESSDQNIKSVTQFLWLTTLISLVSTVMSEEEGVKSTLVISRRIMPDSHKKLVSPSCITLYCSNILRSVEVIVTGREKAEAKAGARPVKMVTQHMVQFFTTVGFNVPETEKLFIEKCSQNDELVDTDELATMFLFISTLL